MESELYHYCSFEAFLAILKNKTIKFSDITKSNDFAEISLLWNKYAEYIEKRCLNKAPPAMLKYEIKQQMNQTDFLVACFTSESDMLHMWSCYANEGVAIGFDQQKMREWCSRISIYDNAVTLNDKTNSSSEFVRFDKITYFDKDELETQISEQCKGMEFVTDRFEEIFRKAPFSKTDFWKIENEWRIAISLIYSPRLEQGEIPKEIYVPQKLEMFVESKNGFQNCVYCCVPFDSTMITSIRLAPNCRVSKEDIEKILLINNFDPSAIDIYQSTGTLR